jgi:hypothetical protein
MTLLGLASWLIPFLVSSLFFDRTGQLLIEQPLFKSIMVVVGGGSGVVLLAVAFKRLIPSAASGLALGSYWLPINLLLDVLVLVLVMKMPIMLYVTDIGVRYLLMPIISTGMGAVAVRAVERAT